MRASSSITFVLAVSVCASSALAQEHEGDLWFGMTSGGCLKLTEDAGFDTEHSVSYLAPSFFPGFYSSNDPGFEQVSLENEEPANDVFVPLADTMCNIQVHTLSLETGLFLQGQSLVDDPGEFFTLLPGNCSSAHYHPSWFVDATTPGLDPLKTLWRGTFKMVDGDGVYCDSQPFDVRSTLDQTCETAYNDALGDVDNSGAYDVFDIEAFYALLNSTPPASCNPEDGPFVCLERCLADGDLDGLVSAADADDIEQILTCQQNLGFGDLGDGRLAACESDALPANTVDILAYDMPAFTTAYVVLSVANNPVPFKGDVLVPSVAPLVLTLPVDGNGRLLIPNISMNAGVLFTYYMQVLYVDGTQPQGLGFTNAIALQFN